MLSNHMKELLASLEGGAILGGPIEAGQASAAKAMFPGVCNRAGAEIKSSGVDDAAVDNPEIENPDDDTPGAGH